METEIKIPALTKSAEKIMCEKIYLCTLEWLKKHIKKDSAKSTTTVAVFTDPIEANGVAKSN